MRRGFTLAELLVAMALALIVGGMAVYSFYSVSQMNDRLIIGSNLDLRASLALTRLERDLANTLPGFAFTASDSELVFATAVPSPDLDQDPTTQVDALWDLPGHDLKHEVVWVKYKYESGTLKRGVKSTLAPSSLETNPTSADLTSMFSDDDLHVILTGVVVGSFDWAVFTPNTTADEGDNLSGGKTYDPVKMDGTGTPANRPARIGITFTLATPDGPGKMPPPEFTRSVGLPGAW